MTVTNVIEYAMEEGKNVCLVALLVKFEQPLDKANLESIVCEVK